MYLQRGAWRVGNLLSAGSPLKVAVAHIIHVCIGDKFGEKERLL